MTESEGSDNQDGTAVPGKKKRGSRARRLRPYAFAVVAMAVVFGISAVIGAHVRAGKGDSVTAPSNAAAPAAVPTGPVDAAAPTPSPSVKGPKFDLAVHPSVPVTVTVYEDLRSPASKAFADQYGPVLDQLLTTGQAQLHYRLVTASDKKYGGEGSLDAANAAACAQDQGRFKQFVDQVFMNQPDPQSITLTKKSVLRKLAVKAHKIKMSTFDTCLDQAEHRGWVEKSQQDYAASGLGAVPVMQINGTTVKNVASALTPEKLHTMVLAEAARVVALQDVPSATPTTTG